VATATERVVLLMTKPEKRALVAKARRMGGSIAQLVRKSVEAFDPDSDYREIEKMLDLFTTSHRETIASLDRAEQELAETRAYFANKAAGRAA
jgi:hypothetical protein